MLKKRIDLLKSWRQERDEEGISFCFPAESGAGIRPYGFDTVNDAAEDVMRWYGLRLGVETAWVNGEITVTAEFYYGQKLSYSLHFAETGRHDCEICLKDFPVEEAQANIWRNLTAIRICGAAQVYRAELVRGNGLYVESDVLGKAGDIGERVVYRVKVHNCLEKSVSVRSFQLFEGWESMPAQISPADFRLEPEGAQEVEVSVQVHDYMPAGAHEKTKVRFVPEGNSAQAAEAVFMTLRRLEHPYIYHTAEKWQEVKENIEKYDVFKPEYERIRKDADVWEVPPIVPFGERDYCYDTRQEHYIMSCAYMYAITGESCYAEKIYDFFQSFMNKDIGYPVRKKGCSQSYVQEGHFFQHLALAYDMTYNSPLWSAQDRQGVETCFRIYMDILARHIDSGHISNWTLSELTGAVYCAMVLQDFERMERFLEGPSGSFEQLCHGAFSDGWWYECSIGYNIWVSSMYLHTAHALLPFGINIFHRQFPLSYGKEVDSIYGCAKREIRHGMYDEKWGGMQKSYICIKDLFDAVLPFLDYRGVMAGVNDSAEKKISGVHFGSTFDLAYTHYQDPAYIPVIPLFETVDPIFGHAELPETEQTLGTENAFSDNIGIMVLRSRKEGRTPGEQIQAMLRYGSHGFAHGHFDRTELLSVMRYGRSFYNPESIWWGYAHFMYKFYVQNSNTKNMVVVDGKMQIPADAQRVLFYSGTSFQAGAVRTSSRWGFPPFGGMIYDNGDSLVQRCERNASDLSCYDAAEYGEITEATEKICQTRVMVVLDDCIVLFDCMEGETEHLYESLMEIKGFRELVPVNEKGSIEATHHTGRKSDNPKSDTQFITDCCWYQAEGETVARFETRFGDGADNRGNRGEYNEPGSLNLDIYTAWPLKTQQMHGLEAEDLGVRVPYDMRVLADGECRMEYSANAWLLGARELDIAVEPECRTLTLEIFNKPIYSEQNYPYAGPQGLFLGDSYVELEDGSKVAILGLSVQRVNIDEGCGIGRDYQNGRVLIEGIEYLDAIPISPIDHDKKAYITIDLSGLRAIRFHGIVGADNFPGPEEERRRHYAVGQTAREGRFITVIEPYEGTGKIASVEGISDEKVKIWYTDGSWQEITAETIKEIPYVTVDTDRIGQRQHEHS